MNDKETPDDYAGALPEAELDEVWALYAEDGRETLDSVEETLLALELAPTDTEQITRLFRGLHTFKGNARMMGLEVSELLSHHAEDLVAVVRDEGVLLTSAMVDLLLEVLDQSRGMLDHAMTYRRDVEAAQVEGLMAKLRDMLAERPEQALSLHETSVEGVDKAALVRTEDASTPRSEDVRVSQFEDEPFILVEELTDPTTDPEYVRIFMEMAESEMSCLRAALDALTDGSEGEERDSIQEIKAVVDTLTHAVGRMGYEHLVTILDELGTTVDDLDGEARIVGIERLESALSRELAAIQSVYPSTLDAPSASGQAQPPELEESVQPLSRKPRRDRLAEQLQMAVSEALVIDQPSADEDIVYRDIFDLEPSQRRFESPRSPQPPRPPESVYGFGEESIAIVDLPDATRLFRSWCKARMLADLARLGEVMDDLEQFVRQFLVGGSALAWDEGLVNEVAYLLRGIYYSGVFHRLDRGAHITLALEDLYTRVAEGEMALNEALLDLTRTFTTQMSIVIETVGTGETPDTAILADLLSQTEEMLHLHQQFPFWSNLLNYNVKKAQVKQIFC